MLKYPHFNDVYAEGVLKAKVKRIGFAYIEIMLIILILIMLTFVAVPSFLGYQTTTKSEQLQMLVKNAQGAMSIIRLKAASKGISRFDKADPRAVITINKKRIRLNYGYPQASYFSDMIDALSVDLQQEWKSLNIYSISTSDIVYSLPGIDCQVRYQEALSMKQPAQIELLGEVCDGA